MSKVTIEAWRCDRCKWVWVAKKKPMRCSKCKSRTWDVGDTLRSRVVSPEPKTKAEFVRGFVKAVSEGDVVLSVPKPLNFYERSHDVKSCRVYKCGLCALEKEKRV